MLRISHKTYFTITTSSPSFAYKPEVLLLK